MTDKSSYIKMPETAVLLTTPRILHTHLELDFILNEVFHGINVTTDHRDAATASTVVYSEYDLDINLIKYLKENGKRLVLLHLGDERATKDLEGYNYADAILRNYYFDQILTDERWRHKIHWLPNGYRSGVGTRPGMAPKRITERKQLACFIGWLGNHQAQGDERSIFANEVEHIRDLINCIPTQGFAAGFSPLLYRQIMEDTIFAPSPAGNAHETIRLCDAMEIGCIPISTRHPYLSSSLGMGGAPIVFIDNWTELATILRTARQDLSVNAETLVTAQTAVKNYWNAFKRKSNAIAAMATYSCPC
jgi:hypothetical protein